MNTSTIIDEVLAEENAFEMGAPVSFVGPCGSRLNGCIVKVYPTNFDYQVEVAGRCYCVSLNDDIRRSE